MGYGLIRMMLCVSLFCAFNIPLLNPVQAQITYSDRGAVDKQAEMLLKKAADRFAGNVGFTVTATMFDSKHKPTMTQTAQVLYNRGKYRLTIEGQEIVCDGVTLWQWDKQAREVAVNKMVDDDMNLFNPARLLANYHNNFKEKYIRTEEDGTAIVDLQPRSARSFHKIRLFVNEADGLLKRIEVHKYDSSREQYVISRFKKTSTPASQFTFDPAQHAGVEVIDMR